MDTQLSRTYNRFWRKIMIDRKKYAKEFKLEAIRMYENSERTASEIERELGITSGLLSRWKQQFDKVTKKGEVFPCLLYTSDAADEEDSVDLGGRRIIKQN